MPEAEPKNQPEPSRLAILWEYVWTLGLMALVVFGARSSLADWYEVPSGSMLPTILEGDRIFVNKLAYNLRVPFSTKEITDLGELQRGDIVVFLFPEDGKTDYVKRLVGLPGDTIEVRNDVLYINSEPQVRRAALPSELPPGVELESGKDVFVENLFGVNHLVYERPGSSTNYAYVEGKEGNRRSNHINRRPGPGDTLKKVEPGTFFAMGDNRDNSSDSRAWGLVPMHYMKGRALRVVLSIERKGPCYGLAPACRLGLLDPRRFRLERGFLSLYDGFEP